MGYIKMGPEGNILENSSISTFQQGFTGLTGLDCTTADKRQVKALLPVKSVPEKEGWRLGLLDILLLERRVLEKEGSDTKRVISMISSLCST